MLIETGYQVPEKPDTLITHHILADSQEQMWLLFQSHYRSLAFGTSGDGGRTWSPARELLSDISGPFSYFTGAGKNLYVVARKTHPPDIHLITWDGEKWSEGTIFTASGKQVLTSQPLIIEDSNSLVHIVFALRGYTSAEWNIKHLMIDLTKGKMTGCSVPALSEPSPGFPARFDFLKEVLYWSGSLLIDSENGLHLACRSFSEGHYHIFYSSYNNATGKWNNLLPLTKTPFHRGNPGMITGSDGKSIYVVFNVEEDTGYNMVCLSRDPGGNWSKQRVLGSEIKNDTPPVLVKTPTGPLAYWADGYGISRAFLEVNHPTKRVFTEKVSSLSAAFAGGRVLLACTGLSQGKNRILLAEDYI
ncbi:MAG: sialidase family protein [Bacillota bacterium]